MMWGRLWIGANDGVTSWIIWKFSSLNSLCFCFLMWFPIMDFLNFSGKFPFDCFGVPLKSAGWKCVFFLLILKYFMWIYTAKLVCFKWIKNLVYTIPQVIITRLVGDPCQSRGLVSVLLETHSRDTNCLLAWWKVVLSVRFWTSPEVRLVCFSRRTAETRTACSPAGRSCYQPDSGPVPRLG